MSKTLEVLEQSLVNYETLWREWLDEAPDGSWDRLATERNIAEAKEAISKIKAEIKSLHHVSTDRRYMLEAYENMLGPKGLEVVKMWREKGIKRIHFDWAPGAFELTGEERAQFILDLKKSLASAVPDDDNVSL